MKARFAHFCSCIYDKEKTIKFYEEALGMHQDGEMTHPDGIWTKYMMKNDASEVLMELTYKPGFEGEFENCGKDAHIAFYVEDFQASYKLHKEMGIIVLDAAEKFGVYFITDPEGTWIEIMPEG